MCNSCPNDFISLDMNAIQIPWGGQEHVVKTKYGSISVYVCGDQSKPALITYPDVALNYMSCFQGLFLCTEAASLLFHNFCIYHIDAPGHELGAAPIPSNQPLLTVEDLADQVVDVLDYFGIQEAMCMGAMAGAYVLTLFALRHQDRVLGLILVSPLCRTPSWTEWAYNKMMANVLYFYGMCNLVKDNLLKRYFSHSLHIDSGYSGSDIIEACTRLLDERQSDNVMRFLEAINRRNDLTTKLKSLKHPTLIFVGEQSPFYKEALHFASSTNHNITALVEVERCGSLVTEEHPQAMSTPFEYFLNGYGMYKPTPHHYPSYSYTNVSHSYSPLSPPCISPELLSPESLGLKLKPIKTRIPSKDLV